MCKMLRDDPAKSGSEDSGDDEEISEVADAEENGEASDSDVSNSDEDEDSDVEDDVPDVGEEPGTSADSDIVKNPFYEGSDNDDISDSDDDADSDDSDSDSDPDDEGDEAEASKTDKSKGGDDDDIIAALKAAREKQTRDSPPDIKTRESITDISFHPEDDMIALVNMVGELAIFSLSNEKNQGVKKMKIHKGNVRVVEFDPDGKSIVTGGKDKSLKVIDCETWSIKWKQDAAHPSALYSVLPVDSGAHWPQGCFSGDEDGTVRLWDYRTNKYVMTSKRFEEFVSSFHLDETGNTMVAASGEGTIQSWDLRMKKAEIQSEVYSCELNCMGTVRGDSKLVVGGSNGTLYLFNRAQYGLHSDQFPGHPDAINALVAVTDNVVITGCEDGRIRAYHLFPHRFIGQVGHQGHLPVERLDISSSGKILASSGHDNQVKFWNISYLEQMDYDKKRKPVVQPKGVKKSRIDQTIAKEQEYQLPSSGISNKGDFFKEFAENT